MSIDNQNKPRRKLGWKIIVIPVILILIAVWGISSRVYSSSQLDKTTNDQAIPTVGVMKPKKNAGDEEIVLPGSVQAWHEAPIYARTSGYLKSWVTDIGTPVKAGALLATIETPEVDAQLRQAQADLKTAEANNELSQSTAKRWADLLKTDSVSKQEADEKQSDASAKAALVAAAKANVDRLTDLESFKRVTAPFDGIITTRNTDTGALINAGSTSAPELFHIADITKLRIYVQVPQTYTAAITPDLIAELHFAEHPGKIYKAKLIKTANALDPSARTLLVQFEADNQDGELLAGGFTEVHMKLPTKVETLILPVNTLMYRGTDMQVAVVQNADSQKNAKAILKTITLGRDFGNEVEVTSGLNPDDQVVVNPPDSLISGQDIKIAEPAKPADGKDAKDGKADAKPAEKKEGDGKK